MGQDLDINNAFGESGSTINFKIFNISENSKSNFQIATASHSAHMGSSTTQTCGEKNIFGYDIEFLLTRRPDRHNPAPLFLAAGDSMSFDVETCPGIKFYSYTAFCFIVRVSEDTNIVYRYGAIHPPDCPVADSLKYSVNDLLRLGNSREFIDAYIDRELGGSSALDINNLSDQEHDMPLICNQRVTIVIDGESKPNTKCGDQGDLGITEITSASYEEERAHTFNLEQNYPNPFNSITTITYTVKRPGFVRLVIYDMRGQEVDILVNRHQIAGKHVVRFDAGNLPSGTYAYRLKSEETAFIRMMALVK